MSHVITMENVKLSQAAAERAAQFFGWRTSQVKNLTLAYGSQPVSGLAIHIPSWDKPVVISADGTVRYDNYHGNWGDIKELEKLVGYGLIAMDESSTIDLSQVSMIAQGDELVFQTPDYL